MTDNATALLRGFEQNESNVWGDKVMNELAASLITHISGF